MDTAHKDELRRRIGEELDALTAHIKALEDATDEPVSPDVAIGRLSRLDTMLNQGVAKTSLGQARARVRRLREALVRLDEDPDFGHCVECGDPIPIARLLALPESERCVDCAE